MALPADFATHFERIYVFVSIYVYFIFCPDADRSTTLLERALARAHPHSRLADTRDTHIHMCVYICIFISTSEVETERKRITRRWHFRASRIYFCVSLLRSFQRFHMCVYVLHVTNTWVRVVCTYVRIAAAFPREATSSAAIYRITFTRDLWAGDLFPALSYRVWRIYRQSKKVF